MLHITRKSLAITATTALATGALLLPAAAPAKSVKFTITTGKLKLGSGGKVTGEASGTFGKATLSGTVVPPKVTLKLRVKGGTITISSSDAHVSGGKVVGRIRLKGTGKYKKLKGKGTFTGSPATFVFKYKGTATY